MQMRSSFAKLTPENALSAQEIAEHQRGRLLAAMIELVAERGYRGATISELTAVSRVSRRQMYEHFGNKEEYFLATYDVIVGRAALNVNAAFRSERDPMRQLERGFAAFVDEVVEQPQAARLGLIEALGAGPRALGRMELASATFERLIASSFERTADGAGLPRLVARGIVGGISRVVRQLLIESREGELRGVAHDLVKWILCYRCADAMSLPSAPKPEVLGRPPITRATAIDERTRLVGAAASIAAAESYGAMNSARIAQVAQVSLDTFLSLFKNADECFLAAYEEMGSEVAAAVAGAGAQGEDWIEGIEAGVSALMHRIARDPVFARIAFVEIFAAGPPGNGLRSELMAKFTDLLTVSIPVANQPSKLVSEAIVGAIWQNAHYYVLRGATQQLPALIDHARYLALAPVIGAREAMERISG